MLHVNVEICYEGTNVADPSGVELHGAGKVRCYKWSDRPQAVGVSRSIPGKRPQGTRIKHPDRLRLSAASELVSDVLGVSLQKPIWLEQTDALAGRLCFPLPGRAQVAGEGLPRPKYVEE